MENITDPFVKFFLALFFIVLIIFFLTRKQPKTTLAEYYGIHKKTLGKWVRYFSRTIEFDSWNRRRKYTNFELEKLKEEFGQEKDMVMTKQMMAAKMGCSRKTLAKIVICKLDELGLTLEAWSGCSAFPPAVCKRILEIK